MALTIGLAAVASRLRFPAPDEPVSPPMAAASPLASHDTAGGILRPPEDSPPSSTASSPPPTTQWLSHDWIETPPRGGLGGLGQRRSAILGGTAGLRPELLGSPLVHTNDDPVLCRTCLLYQLVGGGL